MPTVQLKLENCPKEKCEISWRDDVGEQGKRIGRMRAMRVPERVSRSFHANQKNLRAIFAAIELVFGVDVSETGCVRRRHHFRRTREEAPSVACIGAN